MDRLNQIRSEAGGSSECSLNTSSAQSEAYLSATDNSKYFSLSEDECTFNISKDTLIPEQEAPVIDSKITPNLSPIPKSDIDTYKIGDQIEAANILSGGINIFDDNDNSYDGDELVIDDNAAVVDEKTISEDKLSDDVEYSKIDNNLGATIDVDPIIPSKDTEVVLQIDGKNVDAIDIGNGLYLYRKNGEEELAAVQIIDDDQHQSSFKFLKVRENTEGNLEVYEEIEIEVPKDTPIKEVKPSKNVHQVSIHDVDNNFNDSNKGEKKMTTPRKENSSTETNEFSKELQSESKKEVNLNGKMIKFSESRKSPVVGSFTPMTFQSTPNKEGIPLTKTMVDQHLQPSRYSDNTKKTIEVHTDSSKQRVLDTPVKNFREVLEAKMELDEKECKQPSVEIEDRQKCLKEKEINVQESINVKNSKCEQVKDNAKSSTEVDDIDQISDSVTSAETAKVDKSAENAVIKSNFHNHDSDINLLLNDYELQTKVIDNKEILESSKSPDNSIQVNEVISNDIAFFKGGLNEQKSTELRENTPVTVASTKEAQIDSSNLNDDDKKKDSGVIPNESVVANKNTLNVTYETHSAGDNEVNSCESKTELINNELVDDVNNKLIPDQQKQLQSTSLDSEINLSQRQDNLLPKEVTNLSDKECVDFDTNLSTENLGNVLPIDDALKTNLAENASPMNHDIDQGNSKVDEHLKVFTEDTNTESKVCTDLVEKNKEVNNSLFMNKTQLVIKDKTEKTPPKINNDSNIKNLNVKPVNNKNTAVPFGKWTEANRQEFLNKIKESKIPSNTSSTKQIKQPNDLNRRDILQKIDSQRQQHSNIAIPKVQEQQKSMTKEESSAFIKSTIKHDTKIPVKERPTIKSKAVYNKKNENEASKPPTEPSNITIQNVNKKESLQRREINNQDLIDKTVEDIINKVIPVTKASKEESKQREQNMEGVEKQKGMTLFGPLYHARNECVSFSEIEMKMNELHGIPLIERPAHELPHKFTVDTIPLTTESLRKTSGENKISTPSQIPIVLQQTSQQTMSEAVVDIDSEEEIIEHEPITGDVNLKKKSAKVVEKGQTVDISQMQKAVGPHKKNVIITEKDFDKFFRRNSVTYENCLTVNFDGKEQYNVVQTVVEKDAPPKKLTRNEVLLAESKAKSTHKLQMLHARHNNNPSKIPTAAKYQAPEEDVYRKNYQPKLQIAYQSALTANRQKESPTKMFKEKPVKVVFMDSNVDFIPCQLNVQGEKLSPIKQLTSEHENSHSTTDSLDSDILDNYNSKSYDEAKTKSKHQRKQVLTPVETADIEIIEPNNPENDISPKKKRKIEEKPEKHLRNHVPKKSYLLGRTNNDEQIKAQDVDKVSFKEITNHNSFIGHSNSITAIDNLVKAAELLENQAESNCNPNKTLDSDIQQNTPVKRGRGRPRKYPLPDAEPNKIKVPSPQKKPRLIDSKVKKRQETDEDDTSDDEIIKENWTMGKINENIICPICDKLFRSENVVFKHVKHCTGPSPNRSESDKRRLRESRDSHQSILELEDNETKEKRKLRENVSKSFTHSGEAVVMEDMSLTKKPSKQHVSRKSMANLNIVNKHSLVCEICGKAFRQASYLAHHKLQHQNDELKNRENATNDKKSIFSCEVCKKEFRKLHHLVQHRIIHNSNPVPSRTLRNSGSSLEQGDSKVVKEQIRVKRNEDQSAGFRCEPCDKSFRKLHHLVEHRETHDGINRQKATEVDTVKPVPLHQCDICDKTFKKLQLLNEHKDQHLETCSEKSDDKSVKSCLSTKDIIHECSLCYMVFPNEHSLNKHTVICLRKKKQAAAKAKLAALKKEPVEDEGDSEHKKSEECDPNDEDDSVIIVENHEVQDVSAPVKVELDNDNVVEDVINMTHSTLKISDPIIPANSTIAPPIDQKDINISESVKEESLDLSRMSKENMVKKPVAEFSIHKKINIPVQTPPKRKQREDQVLQKDLHKQIHKKRTPAKDKLVATVTKRQKSVNMQLAVTEEIKLSAESSDDDDVRYMLNPDFKENEDLQGKNFMKVKAQKRNSLQIERPNSNNLVKRRISLQHPPKISRLKNKLLEKKPVPATSAKYTIPKIEEPVTVVPIDFTDSEDSDTKYAFPETIKNMGTVPKIEKKSEKRKSLGLKRKSLNGIAKRKSLGKAIKTKHKPGPVQTKPKKKRTTEVEHRCDCGKLFSSAALLSRHTTLDHTPPRSRRRRSPAPAPLPDNQPIVKEDKPPVPKTARRSTLAAKTTANEQEGAPPGRSRVATRNSVANRSPAHRGVPVPEKLKKLMKKSKM